MSVGDYIHAVFSDICWTSALIRRYKPVFVFMAATSQQRDFVSELCVSSWSNLSAGLSWGSHCHCCLCSQFMDRQLFVLWLICICAALWESIIFFFGLICDNTPWNNNVVAVRSRQAWHPEPLHPESRFSVMLTIHLCKAPSFHNQSHLIYSQTFWMCALNAADLMAVVNIL